MIFENTRLKRIPITAVLFMFGTIGLTMQVNAQETMGEVFICDFNDDQDMEDLLKAKDYYLKQAEKAGVPTPPAFVWTPIKGGGDLDFLWFNYYQNAADYGATADAWAASSDFQSAVDRFNQVSTCRSSLFTQDQIYDGGEALDTSSTYLQSSACNFRPGAGMSSMADLRTHITGYLDDAGTHKSFLLFQRSAVTPGPNSPDIRFVSINNNATDWAARYESINGTQGGQMLARHFQSVLDCSIRHYSSTNMVPFPDQ
jgi:hypothetical protein